MLKKIFFSINIMFFLFSLPSYSEEKIKNYKNYPSTKVDFKLEKVTDSNLNYPWGMTFIDQNHLLITEKNGKILKVNVRNGVVNEIKHSIKSIGYKNNKFGAQQGGLLDILYHKNYLYFTYSHDFSTIKKNGKPIKNSSTAIAKGKLLNNEIKSLEILLVSTPGLNINKHWGSRIVIKNDQLFATFGERDQGMIAQDSTKHQGSIIRINLDGSIPNDNPHFKGYPNWLPEIFQIGFRNPQGLTISPFSKEIYFTQHGPMGGDNFGKVKYGGNLGWKDVAWGGKEYSGLKIGKVPFKNKYDQPIFSWVPSIGIGNLNFYTGDQFPEWNGDLIISATKAKMLFRLEFKNNDIVKEEYIIKNHQEIGRIRDFEIDAYGNIFLIVDDEKSSLWKISKN